MTETKKQRLAEMRKNFTDGIMEVIYENDLQFEQHSPYHFRINCILDVWTSGKYWFVGTGAKGTIEHPSEIIRLLD